MADEAQEAHEAHEAHEALEAICQNCRYWDPQWKFKREQHYDKPASSLDISNPRSTSRFRKDSTKGLCRRYAPQASPLTAVWMETKNADWCGDYAPAPTAEN